MAWEPRTELGNLYGAGVLHTYMALGKGVLDCVHVAPRHLAARQWQSRHMQILVVDDDQAVRDSLSRSLHYSGYEVITAGDGLEALARLSSSRPAATTTWPSRSRWTSCSRGCVR